MFNLFKKSEEQPKVETLVVEKKSKYPTIVDEIHNEFFTAGDKILEEANGILAECKAKDVQKGKRLASLGFTKALQAVQALEIESLLISTKEVAELVSYYSIHYPNNKFITESQVKQICEKYSLVCGNVSMYKGFVPENKLSLIENFKLKDKDIPFAEVICDKHRIDGFDVSESNVLAGFLNKEDINDDWAIKTIENGSYFYFAGKSISSDKNRVKNSITQMYNNLWGYVKAQPFNKELKICAPLKDMEIPKGKEVRGYKIQDIPDPVVLQPVKGGYLILAAWGNESEDPIVINEQMN